MPKSLSRPFWISVCLAVLVFAGSAAEAGERVIRLTPRETTALVNGSAVAMDVPAFIEAGHTLVPLRFVGEALDLGIDWQPDTKAVRLTAPQQLITLRIGHNEALVDGQPLPLPTPASVRDGRTVVPLRFVAQALGATVDFDASTRLITIRLHPVSKTPPVARFSLSRTVIRPGEGVAVQDESFHPDGVDIVEREWTGLAETYPRVGRYAITLRVKDANGNWSPAFTRELVVNTPPVAAFRTHKSEYKLGEPVIYLNESYDPDGHELRFTWTNKEPAFFEAGDHLVILEAEDPLGGTSRSEVVVKVSNEVHYTRTEYHLLYGEPKQVIPFEGPVLSYRALNPPVTENRRTLLKSNSPEEITASGILYQDAAAGPVRLMWHHLNKTSRDLTIHVLAHNPAPEAVTVKVTRQGVSRPSPGVLHHGREYLARFFSDQAPRTLTIPAGQTVNLLAAGPSVLKPDFCVSGMIDLWVNIPVVFSFVAVPAGADPTALIPDLPVLPPNGKQVRGTYRSADRRIIVPAGAAGPGTRLILGDGPYDPPLAGTDALTGAEVLNRGNYGMVYEILFERIEAGTVVLLNPRGGLFCGALKKNGLVWETPVERFLSPQREAVIIERMEHSGPLHLEYSPPSGSYLPVNILLVRLPENKER